MKNIIVLITLILGVGLASAQEPAPPAPEFEQNSFLLDSAVPKLDIDFALVWTDSMGMLFVAPFDAVVLHVEVESNSKDVFIISDVGMNRLTILQCALGNDRARTIEKITIYSGDDAGGLKAPSGLATTAINRIFNPEKDVIFLADRGNNRILQLLYSPDSEGGKIFFNRAFGNEWLEWPVDIAITDYGTGNEASADLYVVDMGHSEDSGQLLRFSIYGDFEGAWTQIDFPSADGFNWRLNRPVSVAAYYDSKNDTTSIFITEETSNSIFQLTASTSADPVYAWSQTLEIGGNYWKPGGIAVDGVGRIYAANSMTGRIETFGPNLEEWYPPFGGSGDGPGLFSNPSNIIIDMYHDFCEALIIEWYGRQSGLQTYIISNGISSSKMSQGFIASNLVQAKPAKSGSIPFDYYLHDAYPNPFNGECVISFELPEASRVSILLYDILGRLTATIADGDYQPGVQSVKFNGNKLASGVYFYKMKAGDFSKIKSLVLVK